MPEVLGVSLRSGSLRLYAPEAEQLITKWRENWPFPDLRLLGERWVQPDMEDVFTAYSQGYDGVLKRFDSWWSLFPRSERLSLWELLWMRWIGESVSTLVPSASVGGDVVRARLAALHGASIPTAAASVLVDITLGVFVQIVFTLLGLALIVTATGQQSFIRPTLIGAVVGVLAIVGFYVVQRLGMFRFIGKMISRLANADDWHSLVHSGHTLDEAIRTQYARRSGVVGCCIWTGASLVLGSGEIWMALHALGLHATVVNSVILQSMGAFTASHH